MALAYRDVLVSGLFALAALAVLWPPGAVYWTRVANVLGNGPTLAIVGVVATGLAVAFARVTDVGVRRFALGTSAAVIAVTVGIALLLSPDSPVHVFLYAALAGCLVAGVALWRHADRLDLARLSGG